jgi:acyl-CoA thioester hydrolase
MPNLQAQPQARRDGAAGPPPLEEILTWPSLLSERVDPGFIDANGHMNFAWYMHLFNRASWAFFTAIGLDAAEMQRSGTGPFAVEANQRFFAELFVGDRVAIHTRVVTLGAKSITHQHAMVDVARQRVAATVQIVAVHVDKGSRRAVPFPVEHSQRAERFGL